MRKVFSGLQLVFFLFLFCVIMPFGYAQEAGEGEIAGDGTVSGEAAVPAADGENAPPVPAPVVELTPELKRIDMEIKTSSLTELALMCRVLGLSEGGDVAALRSRLWEYYKISTDTGIVIEDNRKIITIESARSTEYFTIEAVDEDYARLTGDVRLSLKDGEAIHRIRAWEILFNRSRNIITASGGVEYVKEDGEKIETFRGESITVNIDDWSSIFLGGISERSIQGDGTTYLFSGTVITRDDEDVTILSKASIGTQGGNAVKDEPLWSLNASRVWLLPGSDFAIFNAVLKVGEIPVLYIPFFYYPADEVVFHPVIGSRTREGNFIQTTTYILGRPAASTTTESSLTKILGNSSDMEKVREGLFLRSTGKKIQEQSPASLKVMLDYYTNLGGYLGAELVTPQFGILNPVNLGVGIGLSRTIMLTSSGHTPFAPNYDGTSDWNKSNFFSKEVPFRYLIKFDSSINGKYGSFSWNIPYHSDPLLEKDFFNRSEAMDWVNMIQKGAALEAEESTESLMGAPAWSFSGSMKPTFPNMAPFISSISIGSVSSSISFKTVDTNPSDSNDPKYYSPSRYFYAPSSATLYSVSGSLAGTPLSLGGTQSAAQTPPASETEQEKQDPFNGIGTPRSPWEAEITGEEISVNTADTLVPPVLDQRFTLGTSGNTQLTFGYSFSPQATSELQFDSEKWKEYSDVNWGDVSSVRSTLSGNASTTLNLNHTSGFFSNSFVFSGNGQYRNYNFMNEESAGFDSEDERAAARKDMYNQTYFNTNYSLTSSMRPLYRSGIFGQSNLSYRLGGLAVKSKFTGDGDNPEWEMEYGKWDKENITTHQFSANMNASIMAKSQSFTLSTELPPRDPAISTSASLNVWIISNQSSLRIVNPGEDKQKIEPYTSNTTISFGTFGSLTHNMVLDTELREFTRINTNLNLTKLGLSASYSATRMTGYRLEIQADGTPSGWVTNTGEPSLKSNDLRFSFSKSLSQIEIWKDRMNFSFSVNSSLNFNLQQYTSSRFTFGLTFRLAIAKFLDLSMSFNSENAVIYRYYRSLLPGLPDTILNDEGEQYNLFSDLLNSFRFDDDARRRSSGFKMKSFSLQASHFMGDWNANLTVSMAPYRPTNSNSYQLGSEISFIVQWLPISEIKTDMSYSKQNDRWIVK